jgi:hypothetical protein
MIEAHYILSGKGRVKRESFSKIVAGVECQVSGMGWQVAGVRWLFSLWVVGGVCEDSVVFHKGFS